jgi:DNA helicase-2/ATP-dependent DNA helicase PcrA
LLPESARAGSAAPTRSRGARTCVECGRPLESKAEKLRRRCADCPVPYDEELFERLREWRKERARTDEVAAFMVFSNSTLEQIAEHRPRTPDALLRISGVGPDKLQKYGEELLTLVE